MDTALNRTLQALTDPTRREILRMLGKRDMNAGDIAAAVGEADASAIGLPGRRVEAMRAGIRMIGFKAGPLRR